MDTSVASLISPHFTNLIPVYRIGGTQLMKKKLIQEAALFLNTFVNNFKIKTKMYGTVSLSQEMPENKKDTE